MNPCLRLEGHEIQITGEQIGLDGAGNSFVYIPDLVFLVLSKLFFNSHLRPPADTAPLYETLARIAALNPEIVVCGSSGKDSNSDASVLQFIPKYIDVFPELLTNLPMPRKSVAKMKALYPGLAREDALEQAANTAFTPPAAPPAAPAR